MTYMYLGEYANKQYQSVTYILTPTWRNKRIRYCFMEK